MDMIFEDDKVNKNKIKVTKAYIIIEGTLEKPYYGILYHEVGKDYDTIGFGSYCLDNVRQWKEECLEIAEDCIEFIERISI